MAAGESIPVWPRQESDDGNPYVAQISVEADYTMGHIRIEPPCHFEQDALETISTDVGVRVYNEVSGREATLYDFYVDPGKSFRNDEGTAMMTPLDRVIYTVQKGMLARLGKIANKDLL